MKNVLVASVVGASLAILTVAGAASAQDAPEKPAAAPAAATGSDHDDVVGRIGIGYYGISQVPLAAGQVSAPVVGVRYWLDEGMGFDVGLGLLSTGGKTEVKAGGTTTSNDKAGVTAFVLHGGLPLSLYAAKHYSFQVIPEFNFGMASQTIKGQNGVEDIKNSGMRIDLGARAGAEIHFGFIGVPELTLTGAVGLFVTSQSGKSEQGQNSSSDSNTAIATTAYNNPWDFFTTSVAARYYF